MLREKHTLFYTFNRNLRKFLFLFFYFFYFYFYFILLYNTVLVLPYINMNLPRVYMRFPSETPLPLPSSSNPSGSSQFTRCEDPVSCIKLGLVIYFTYGNIHVSVLFSQIIPPSPSPTESKRLFFTSVSPLLPCMRDQQYRLSKFRIYALKYCIGVFLSDLLHSV